MENCLARCLALSSTIGIGKEVELKINSTILFNIRVACSIIDTGSVT